MNGAELAGAKSQNPTARVGDGVTMTSVEEWVTPVEEAQQKRNKK